MQYSLQHLFSWKRVHCRPSFIKRSFTKSANNKSMIWYLWILYDKLRKYRQIIMTCWILWEFNEIMTLQFCWKKKDLFCENENIFIVNVAKVNMFEVEINLHFFCHMNLIFRLDLASIPKDNHQKCRSTFQHFIEKKNTEIKLNTNKTFACFDCCSFKYEFILIWLRNNRKNKHL